MLPVMFAVPVTFMPVPVTTTTLALPEELILTLPLAIGTLTLLLPLNIVLLLVDMPVNWLPLPKIYAPVTFPPALTLPAFVIISEFEFNVLFMVCIFLQRFPAVWNWQESY